MTKIVLQVEGMRCGMCETHVNEVVRKTADVKKVNSSHAKGQTMILCESEIDVEAVKTAISAQGYNVLSVTSEPYEKKGLFGFLKK